MMGYEGVSATRLGWEKGKGKEKYVHSLWDGMGWDGGLEGWIRLRGIDRFCAVRFSSVHRAAVLPHSP